jgi:hypothetical protein
MNSKRPPKSLRLRPSASASAVRSCRRGSATCVSRSSGAARARKLSQPQWTDDPILATYRFCNVRREDDRVTIWVRQNIREPFADHPNLWLMLCIARQINWPETLQQLIDMGAWPDRETFRPAEITACSTIEARRPEGLHRRLHDLGAVNQGRGQAGLYRRNRDRRPLAPPRRLRSALRGRSVAARTHELIMRTNGWGPFMAYQAVVDMRFTALLDKRRRRIDLGGGRARHDARAQPAARPRQVDGSLSQGAGPAPRCARSTRGAARDRRRDGLLSDVPNILCETDKYLAGQAERRGRSRAAALCDLAEQIGEADGLITMSESTITLSVAGHAPVTLTETQFRTRTAELARRKREQGMGDNTGTNLAADQLKSIVERIERLEEEKAGLSEDIKGRLPGGARQRLRAEGAAPDRQDPQDGCVAEGGA